MQEMWKTFFSSGSFIPHGHCYLWQTELVWLHVASDSIIALAYFSIPITLIYFISQRKDLPFDWIFAMFGAFIVACGITHIFEVWTLWHPTYWLSGTLKAITATISFATAILLVDLIPQALALPSPAQLELANSLLEAEIVERQSAETALKQAKDELEIRVEERTGQLKQQTLHLEQTLLQLQQTQAKLIQSEKMSSLGQVVAGVAHEINNPVNFIYANLAPADEYANNLLELADIYKHHYPKPLPIVQEKLQSLDLDFIREDLPKILSSMKTGADRIRDIVKSLRTFSRLDEAEMKLADIHECIDSTLVMLQNRLNPKPDYPGIEIIKNYGNLLKVECYPGQLNQVFINIFNNAIDAFEEDNQKPQPTSETHLKIIKISTKVVEKKWVEIRIFDNGSGISEEVVEQIFNPFFTTKPVGKGTGLGLSICYQIITERHKGELQCISAPGKGTEFIIKIPISVPELLNN
ncbi:HAMP domain-containing histidine kinase [Microcoleus sp. LEGE 07076]|uniref:sensor histidine kinase n=1 Tax=Microcoleus sp. LEGE 07076 TaxID=915322 RepID=UPI0018804AEB|nr:ATP-binding protein [Microcoleus sp. LEGE 07076]MBE9185026.1 HAMP domain-containing histidine kinase [Microcoleus sp. LEGE 07076]